MFSVGLGISEKVEIDGEDRRGMDIGCGRKVNTRLLVAINFISGFKGVCIAKFNMRS